SVWSMSIATVLSFAVAFCVRLVFIRRYLARVPWVEVRQGIRELPRLLKFALQLVPGSIANGLASQASTWMLGAVASVRTAGAFLAGYVLDVGIRLSIVRRWVFGDGFGSVLRTGAATLVAGGLAFAAARVLDETLARPFGFVAGGLAGTIVYVAIVLLLGGV